MMTMTMMITITIMLTMMTMTMIGNNSMVLCAHAFSLQSLSSSTSSRQPNRFCNYKNRRPLITTASLSSLPSSSQEQETSQKEPKLPSLSLSSNLPSSDNTLSPEFYKSVYKDLQQQQQQQQQDREDNDNDNDNSDDSIIIKTPWDIGGSGGGNNDSRNNCRPQPAIVRAYKENKIHGHILDAGCGLGENCMYLAQQPHKYYGDNIESITGFDFSKESIQLATDEMEKIMTKEREREHTSSSTSSSSSSSSFYTTPNFITASCTDIADRHDDQELFSAIKNYNSSNNDNDDDNNELYFDVIIDSGLLHCLNDDDAIQYIDQMSKLLQPSTGKFYIGCFSTKNPDPWENPRRINEDYIHNLFNHHSQSHNNENDSTPLWEVELIRDTWWARPPSRGSTMGVHFP